MHALGIEPDAIGDSEAEIAAKQDGIFTRIVQRRRYLPVDLLRLSTTDLMALVSDEAGGKPLKLGSLLSGLMRFIGNRE
jgi:hypothetical protein